MPNEDPAQPQIKFGKKKKEGKWKEVKAGHEYRVKGGEGGIEDRIMYGSSH